MKNLNRPALSFVFMFFSALMFITSCSSNVKSKEVVGDSKEHIMESRVKVPLSITYNGEKRVLNGAGTRKQYFMSIYVAGLYVKEKTNDPIKIINEDQPMSIRIQIISGILTSEVMENAIREALLKTLKGSNQNFKSAIDMICGVFSSEPTHVGDVYLIHYTPGVGISGSKNSKPYSFSSLGDEAHEQIAGNDFMTEMSKHITHTKDGDEAIPGMWFKKALMGVWFSESPVDEQLKESLLGL